MTKNKIDLGLKIAIGVLMIVLAVIVIRTMDEHVVQAGDRAPDFSVTMDDGKRVSLSSFAGKPVVLHFWASWCVPCVEEMPALNAFTQKLAGSGVVVLGISADRNQAAYEKFIKSHPPQFQAAFDPTAEISAMYGTFKYPETYIVDRQGKVYEKFPNVAEWSDDLLQKVKSL